ncbi:MAG: hypothetical protein WCD42_08715 [Rhizomicrobium sp.]
MKHSYIVTALAFCCVSMVPAFGFDDVFEDVSGGAKRHVVSGFLCPVQIGHYDRDAVGVRDTARHADYCAYSARDGVYGTVVLSPLPHNFDPKALITPDIVLQEGAGSRMSAEGVYSLGPAKNLAVYTRTYDAARIEAMRYRVLLAVAAVGNWAVQVTVEYADPRDLETKNEFVNAIFDRAVTQLAGDATTKK